MTRIFLVISLLLFTQFSWGKCDAKYDQLNIPHQDVSSLEDYYYCFGYHHGSDRAWQMDYFRRVALGRNAEVLGWSQLKNDLMMRLLDLESEAKKLWQTFSNEEKKWLEIYSQGVNEGFKTGKNAKEFIDLNYAPEPWKPEDSLMVLLLQSFDQTRKTFFRDYLENQISEEFGAEAEKQFSQNNVPWDNSILKNGEFSEKKLSSKILSTPSQNVVRLWTPFPEIFGKESGSNNWVIAKNKSKSGHAILANDPHLDLKTPLFWYWIHLKMKNNEVIGASLPGVPVVVSGTNGSVSWGLTNSYIKTAEANFLDQTKGDETKSFWPLVWVKLGFLKLPFFFKRFEILNHKWRILPLDVSSDQKVVLSWTGFNLNAKDILPMFDFFRAKNVEHLDEYLKRVGVPSWNFVFADTKGDIGFRVIGRAYKILGNKTWGITKKSTRELEAPIFLSSDEMPHLMKPKRNYIYTANNRHWPEEAEFSGGRAYTQSFRGFRIDELLQERQTLETTKKIQCDDQVVDARFIVPLLVKKLNLLEFQNWNYFSDNNEETTSLFRRMMDIVFEEWKMDEYAFYRFLQGDLPAEKKKDLEKFLTQARHDSKNKKWGDFHRLNFPHLSLNPDWVFSPEIEGVGDTHSVNPGTSKWNDDLNRYEQTAGASMRVIFEMSKKPQIYLALPGKNRNYQQMNGDNPWVSWRNCEYSTIHY